jgi:hypothetical protein
VAELLEVLFVASMQTDEGRFAVVHVAYLNPATLQPSSGYVAIDRYEFVPLDAPISLSARSLTSLASATDPRTSSVVVYPDHTGLLKCHGLLDQGHAYHEFLTFEREELVERPGVFHVAALAPGRIAYYIGYSSTGELRAGERITPPLSVLWRPGPVFASLRIAIGRFVAAAKADAPSEIQSEWDTLTFLPDGNANFVNYIASSWLMGLCRLLLRVRGQRHGGALFLAPSVPVDGVGIKHSLRYDRLARAHRSRAVELGRELVSRRRLWGSGPLDQTPASRTDFATYLVAVNRGREALSAITGAIWFIALLTRVDGCVVATPDLEVAGFGGVIEGTEASPNVWRASDVAATEASLVQVDSSRFGTRHRSMIALCGRVPGGIGFVVSQDGDVRAIAKVGERVVIWENVSLLVNESFGKP